MSTATITRPDPTASANLEKLVRQLEIGGLTSLKPRACAWIEEIVELLDGDDDAYLSESIADCLVDVEEALTSDRVFSPVGSRLVNLYRTNQANMAREDRWRRAAAALRPEQLETHTWRELQRALQAEALGRHDLVELWLDRTEEAVMDAWEGYDRGPILDDEVTAESVLGHKLLREGAEAWLDALEMLRESLGQADRQAILARAEQGQRLLVALQTVKHEDDNLAARMLAAWSN